MEEPTPRDKASARGYEAFVRYKRFINKGMGSSGGDLTRQKLCFVKRKRYLAKPNLDLGARAVVSFPNPR